MFGQFLAQSGSVVDRIQSAAEYFQNPELTAANVSIEAIFFTKFSLIVTARADRGDATVGHPASQQIETEKEITRFPACFL